jgi:hypothetical protein
MKDLLGKQKRAGDVAETTKKEEEASMSEVEKS